MKTTIELPEPLFEQAKSAARSQGITLKALIESGLRMAIHPQSTPVAKAAWPDLTFHPISTQTGHLVEPGQWREAANPTAWPQQK
jgi:hypothetical protein